MVARVQLLSHQLLNQISFAIEIMRKCLTGFRPTVESAGKVVTLLSF